MTMVPLFRKASGMALLGACLLTGACTHGDESASLEGSVAVPPAPRSQMMALAPSRKAAARPVATLPEAAGDIGTVRTRDYVNGLRQDILLKGGAVRGIQNSITILARTDRRDSLDEQVPLYKPTEAAIRSELGGQFPHVAMQVAERDSHNSYGPYGLALGRTGNDVRCLYMWQWIDANRLPPDAGVMGPVSVRVRLCQAATTFDAMASLVDHLAIGVPVASAEAAAADDQVHVIAAPAIAAAEGAPVEAAPARVRRRVAAKRKRTRFARRRREDDREPVQTSAIEPPSGARFMASTTMAPAPARGSQATDIATKLSSDLPPEAYLGPKAAKAY